MPTRWTLSKTTVITGLIILLAAFLRLWRLGDQPYWMDEGYTVNSIMAALERGFHLSGVSVLPSGQAYFCPLYCYPSAALVAWLGADPAVTRALAALFGLLFIPVAYAVTRLLLKSRAAALLTGGLIALSYWQVAWSREARWYTMVAVFFWLALYYFQRFLEDRKKTGFALAAGLTVLAVATHRLAYLLPVIMLAWYFLSRRDPSSRALSLRGAKRRSNLARTLALAALAAIALVALDLTVGQGFIAELPRRLSFHYELPYYLGFLLREYWPLLALGVYGWFSCDDAIVKRGLAKLWLAFLAYLIPLSFLTELVQYRYLFPVTLPLFATAAWTVVSVCQHLRRGPQLAFVTATALTLILTKTVILSPQPFYWLESDDPEKLGLRPHYAYTPQPDWQDAYAFIKKDRQPGDLVISSNPVFTRLYLGEPGYWQRYSYTGTGRESLVTDGHEYYVGAKVIDGLAELQQAAAASHGYFLYDYMAADGKLDPAVLDYVQANFEQVYHKRLNSYSQIWVYRF